MNAKSLTIGGALVLLAVTLIGRFNGLITDYVLLAALVVIGCMMASYIISWAATDSYKKYNWAPNRWKEQAIKRKIFKFAWISAGTPMTLFGAVIMVWNFTGKQLLLGSVVWLHFVALVAVTSPWLWPIMMDSLIPRLKQWARGSKPVIHYDESGNATKATDDGKTVFTGEDEALDRPSEAKRVMHGD